MQSFRTFLSCLPSTFGLKETDLFQPSHLYDYTDFARVLHTLSKVNINLVNQIININYLTIALLLEALQLRQGKGEVRAGLPAAAKDRLLDRRNTGQHYSSPSFVKY